MQFHAGFEILELEHALLEKGLGKIFAWIATGTGELLEDVGQQEAPHAKFRGGRVEIDAGSPLRECLGLLP